MPNETADQPNDELLGRLSEPLDQAGKEMSEAYEDFIFHSMLEKSFIRMLLENCPPLGHELKDIGEARPFVHNKFNMWPYCSLRLTIPTRRMLDRTLWREKRELKEYRLTDPEKPSIVEVAVQFSFWRTFGDCIFCFCLNGFNDYYRAFTIVRAIRRVARRLRKLSYRSGDLGLRAGIVPVVENTIDFSHILYNDGVRRKILADQRGR